MVNKGLLLCVDANSILHRAYHAYPANLTTEDGKPVNAVYGFTSMFLDALLRYKPEYVFCAFDTKKPTFRHVEYVGYKANRPHADQDFIIQYPFVHEVLSALSIPVFMVEGYEADDILGTVNYYILNHKETPVKQVFILTGDRDLYQLVGEKTHVILPKGSFRNLEEFDEQKVLTAMGVTPAQITDLKGLMGDASDNIPGVKGIGPKTAVGLLNKYQSLEKVYENIDSVKSESARTAQLLLDSSESAIMSKKLATISTEVPIDFSYDKAETTSFDGIKAMQLFTKMQFKSLVPKLKKLSSMGLSGVDILEAYNGERGNDVEKTLAEIIEKASALDICKNDFEYKVTPITRMMLPDTFSERIELLQNSISNGNNYFICSGKLLFASKLPKEIGIDSKLVITDGWFTFLNDCNTGINEQYATVKNIEILDFEQLSYTLNTGRSSYSFKDFAEQYGVTSLEATEDELVVKIGLLRLITELVRAKEYILLDRVNDAWKVLSKVKSSIPENIISQIDVKVATAVACMHRNGVKIDLDRVRVTQKAYQSKIDKIEKEVYDIVGHEINIRSPKQLADLLFVHLQLPVQKKTKTGISTDDEVLQNLKGTHPVVEQILRHRLISKIVGTYVNPFLELGKDGEKTLRIHSYFNPMGTTTGRLSSKNPNLQNLPIKSDLGKVVKSFFIPEEGYKLVSFDYSQIDLRVMANMVKDPGLVEAFKNKMDIHKSTAAKIYDVKYEDVTDEMRRNAKTINFGILYGMSSFGLSKAIGVPVREAHAFIENYFSHFPKVKEYVEQTIAFVRQNAYVVSLLGRRRYVPGITASNRIIVSAAEREAVNMPIQGGADDVMRLAIGNIITSDFYDNTNVRLVLQVHDEFIFEIKDEKEYLEKVSGQIKSIMENSINLDVQFTVETNSGYTLDL